MKRIIIGFCAALTAASIAWGSGVMETERKSFQGIDIVEAKMNFVDLEARAANTGAVTMELVDIPNSVEVIWSQVGSRLKIEVKKPFWFIPINFHGKIVLTLPKNTELELDSASGSIQVEGMDGPRITLGTASGGIQLEGCTGTFDIHSASGSLSLQNCEGGKVLKTASGSIRVESSEGDIAAKSASGSIRLNDVEAVIKAETASGSIKFDGFKGRINASSASGSVSGEDVSITGDSIFRSTSGSVKFELTNAESDFRFELSSVSGSVSAGSARGGKSLTTGSGKILIDAKTVSGSVKFE